MSATQTVRADSLKQGDQVRVRRERVNVTNVEPFERSVGSQGEKAPMVRIWYRRVKSDGRTSFVNHVDLRPSDTVPKYEHVVTT
jgi:uncharacterized Zn finger protein